MAQTEKQLANLEKGRATRFVAGERQANIARKGKAASDKVKREKKTLRQLAEIALAGKIGKPELEARLQAVGLPPTLAGAMLLNAVQKAGVNSNMLRVILELMGELKQQETSVTVNVNPYAGLSEEELRKLAGDDG